MAIKPPSIQRERFRHLANQNGGSFISSGRFGGLSTKDATGLLRQGIRTSSPITYGKQKPLPLSAAHFKPTDVYQIPVDEDESLDPQPHSPEASFHNRDDTDSPLSDAGTVDSDSSPSCSEPSTRQVAGLVSKDVPPRPTREENTDGARRKKCRARTTEKVNSMGSYPPDLPAPAASKSPATEQVKGVVPAVKLVGKRGRDNEVDRKQRRVRRKSKEQRRLPVNELLMVRSPEDYVAEDPDISSIDNQQLDAIADKRTSRPKRKRAADDADQSVDRSTAALAPLSEIRKRLRVPSAKYKSIKALRQKLERPSRNLKPTSSVIRGADGFEGPELFVSAQARASRRRRGPRQPKLLPFRSLALRGGPLPDVTFQYYEDEESKFQPERNESTEYALPAGCPQHEEGTASVTQPTVTRSSKRKVTFSDREDFIMAQLSSISAPQRPRSESEESDVESEESERENEEPAEEARHTPNVYGLKLDEDEPLLSDDERAMTVSPGVTSRPLDARRAGKRPEANPSQSPDLSQLEAWKVSAPNAMREYAASNIDLQCEEPNTGFSIDFRNRATTPGRPVKMIARNSLMEVDDDIDNYEPTSAQVSRSQHKRSDSWLSTRDDARGRSQIATPSRRPPRLRSILKADAQGVGPTPDLDSNVTANTRRNSAVELSSSRYFADASDLLTSPERIQHIIVPRRGSRQTSRNGNEQIQIYDSE